MVLSHLIGPIMERVEQVLMPEHNIFICLITYLILQWSSDLNFADKLSENLSDLKFYHIHSIFFKKRRPPFLPLPLLLHPNISTPIGVFNYLRSSDIMKEGLTNRPTDRAGHREGIYT